MLIQKFTRIEDFKEAIKYCYEFLRNHDNSSEEFLAKFIHKYIDIEVLNEKETVKLAELIHRIDIFMDNYGGSDIENKQIEHFEEEAYDFLNVFKAKLPFYISVNCFGTYDHTIYQVEIWTEKELEYRNINKIKEYFTCK